MVKNWCKKTSNHFRFTAKFPKVITHDKRLKDVEKEIEPFFSSLANLEDKVFALLIQLLPSMGIVEGMNSLRDIIPELDKRFRYIGSSSLEEKKPITLTLFIQSDS
jgi:uncharacterized protein YecE (DUF72 family)